MKPFQRKSAPVPRRWLWPRRSAACSHAGSGPRSSGQLHRLFRGGSWREFRIDIDPHTSPDAVGSITDMKARRPRGRSTRSGRRTASNIFTPTRFPALAEFRRVLRPDGFALITSPDLESAASCLLKHGPEHVLYTSAAGPITAHDILFGHSGSIALGKHYMAHNTGFTSALLGQRLLDAGFPMVLVKREQLDLWAIALMEDADKSALRRECEAAGLDMLAEA